MIYVVCNHSSISWHKTIKSVKHLIEKLAFRKAIQSKTALTVFVTFGHDCPILFTYLSELGTRQHCRVSVTVFSSQQIVDYCIMPAFVVANPLKHRGFNIFRIFFLSLKLYDVVALSLLRS